MKYFPLGKRKPSSSSSASGRKRGELVLMKCRNCGASTKGPYCHLCGQSLFAGKEGFLDSLFSNALSLYAVDFRIFRTLLFLLFYPGKLTKEYCQGRIVGYEHPFKLFWFVALLFFVYFSYKFDPNSVRLSGDVEFNKLFLTLLPYATLLLIPIFSILLFACFRKYEPIFSNHTAFALHFHAFLYLFFAVALMLPDWNISVQWWSLLAIPYLHLMISIFVFYRSKILSSIFKILFILAVYLLAISALLFGLVFVLATIKSSLLF